MAISATRRTVIEFTGDVAFQQLANAATNPTSAGVTEIKTLVLGANTITPPAGFTNKAVTIIPPPGNVVAFTLKGVTGDTGVLIHPNDPTTIALGSTTATFVLSLSNTTNGVRLIWS